MNTFILILITVAFALPRNEDQPFQIGDHLCTSTRDVLCAKGVLIGIANASENIKRATIEIEELIRNKVPNVERFNRNINSEMKVIHEHLPKPHYHINFPKSNNIDKKYLGHLLLEAHYAMSYYYNSIQDILRMNDIFASTSDTWFKQIQNNLQKDIICRYRSILSSYSNEWPSINEVSGIQFSRNNYHSAPSRVHEVHSVVVARLLREWMQSIHSVLIDLEAKFY